MNKVQNYDLCSLLDSFAASGAKMIDTSLLQGVKNFAFKCQRTYQSSCLVGNSNGNILKIVSIYGNLNLGYWLSRVMDGKRDVVLP